MRAKKSRILILKILFCDICYGVQSVYFFAETLSHSDMRILLVEDDIFTSQLLSSLLKNYHYTVDRASDGQVGLELAQQESYDLILLDIQLPRLDGLSVCRQLRSRGCEAPILMLTIRNASDDVVIGLDAGADDYMVKPYDPEQLAARIRSLLRRGQQPLTSQILRWEDLSLNTVSAQVLYRHTEVYLSPTEYKLLLLLMQYPQQVFSRQAVIDHIYSLDDSPSDATVTNLVKDLRRKLKAAGLTHEMIGTVYGFGYRLKAAPELNSPSFNNEATEKDTAQKQQILERFRDCLEERIAEIDEALGALETGELRDQQRQSVIAQAHQLAGTLGMFGATGATELMQTIEQLLMGIEQDADSLAQVSQLRSDLREIPTHCFDLPTPARVG
jgi:DNA-binding response OmpR family regulator